MDAAAVWISSLFGHCTKEQATGADLVFEAENKPTEKKEKKAKKDKIAKTKQDDLTSTAHVAAAPAGEASTGTPVVRLGRTSGKTTRYLIDNGVLQTQKSPGVAFRHSKAESDKVKTGPGPAKWGETVEGTDEGDGWLKVGNLYLPMLYQGVPIIKLAAEANCVEKSVQSEQDAAESKAKPDQDNSEVLREEHELEALRSAQNLKNDEHDIDVEDVEDAAERLHDKQLSEFVQSGLMMPNKQES